MATVDVRQFDGDTIVIHFGGQLTSVDAYTFANSLISFADIIRSINAQVNPGQDIEVRLDATDRGSFRAVLKQAKKGIARLFSSAPEKIFWIIAALIIQNSIEGESTIKVEGDAVTIQKGGETIIISKEVFDQYEQVKENEDVHRNLSKTFRIIERDEAIENFGLSPRPEDEEPVVQIPRKDFGLLIRGPNILRTDEDKKRHKIHEATLIVLKPWVNASNKKWAFEWNGVPISAYVRDEEFLDKVRSHEVRFGNGDALEVDLIAYEELDEERGIWISDKSSYVVKTVHRFLPTPQQRGTLF